MIIHGKNLNCASSHAASDQCSPDVSSTAFVGYNDGTTDGAFVGPVSRCTPLTSGDNYCRQESIRLEIALQISSGKKSFYFFKTRDISCLVLSLHKTIKQCMYQFKLPWTFNFSVLCECPVNHEEGCNRFVYFVGRASIQNVSSPLFICEMPARLFVVEESNNAVEWSYPLSSYLDFLNIQGYLLPFAKLQLIVCLVMVYTYSVLSFLYHHRVGLQL